VSKNGPVSAVVATITPFFLPDSAHTAKIEFTGGLSEKSFAVVNYKTLTADLKVTPDTSKPGFSVFTYQVVALPTPSSPLWFRKQAFTHSAQSGLKGWRVERGMVYRQARWHQGAG